jgi:hypothetical protein
MSIVASFAENAQIEGQLANAQEGVYTFRVQGTICHSIGTLLPLKQEHQALHSCMFSMVNWKHMYKQDAVLWMACRRPYRCNSPACPLSRELICRNVSAS